MVDAVVVVVVEVAVEFAAERGVAGVEVAGEGGLEWSYLGSVDTFPV